MLDNILGAISTPAKIIAWGYAIGMVIVGVVSVPMVAYFLWDMFFGKKKKKREE